MPKFIKHPDSEQRLNFDFITEYSVSESKELVKKRKVYCIDFESSCGTICSFSWVFYNKKKRDKCLKQIDDLLLT